MLPIVVNPLLWYVHEQMKQVPIEVLLKVVVSYYSIEDIEKAKNIIFENFPEENRPRKLQRKINRQGQNKADNNVKDIVEMFHEMAIADGFKTPIFVTANTDFPPLSIVGVDVTALKQDMAVLQKDFLLMQQAKLQDNTELNDIKQAVDELKSLLMKQQNSPAEKKINNLNDRRKKVGEIKSTALNISCNQSAAAPCSTASCAAMITLLQLVLLILKK